MKRRRIKLVWGASDVIRGRWYFGVFGLYDRLEGKREDGLAISVRGVLWWSLSMMVVAYVAATAALFSFWQRNPYCLLSYGDAFFYPVRRSVVAAKKGQAFIAEGQELVKISQWADGARALRQGLILFPGDLKARQTLAKFYLLTNQRAQAVKLLSEGLSDEFPGRSYLQSLFSIAEEGEDYDLVVTTTDRYLGQVKGARADVDRRWMAAQKFGALLAGQRAAEALAFAESAENWEMASEHRVLALLELGRAADATLFLSAWKKRPGADLQAVRRLSVRVNRETGRFDDMERALEDMRVLAPADPRLAVYGVVQRALAGRTDSAMAALDDLIFRFGGLAENLLMVATPLSEIGNRMLFERVFAAVSERGFPKSVFQVLAVQLHVHRGEWGDAAKMLAAMQTTVAQPGQRAQAAQQAWLDWMSRLIAAAELPTATLQESLLGFLRGRPWPIKVYRQTITAMRQAGRRETARDAAEYAAGAFPASRWLHSQKTILGLELAVGRPTESSPQPVVRTKVRGESATMENLDQLLRARNWMQAEILIREIRAFMPPQDWIEKREGDLRLAVVRINQGKQEIPAMLTAARLFLNGDGDRARRMTEVAKEFFDLGDKASAIALVQAVLQRTPDYPPAQRYLKEWNPRRRTNP